MHRVGKHIERDQLGQLVGFVFQVRTVNKTRFGMENDIVERVGGQLSVCVVTVGVRYVRVEIDELCGILCLLKFRFDLFDPVQR